jgi:ATP-dependent Clp protease adapter protein ClpS
MSISKRRRKKQVELHLVNDDSVTFNHVIDTLSNVLPECSVIRAEQIATITHRTGSCHMYTGPSTTAVLLQSILLSRGLRILTKIK